MPFSSVIDRHRVDLEVALTVGVLLVAVNSPLRLTLVVSLTLFSLSALSSSFRRTASSSWTQTYLNSLVLLGVFAFSWVLFVSHESIAARLLTVSGGVLAFGTVLVALGRATVDQLSDKGADSGRLPTELVVPAMAAVLLSIRGFFPLLTTALAVLASVLITRHRISLRTIALIIVLCGATVRYSRSWFDREPYWFFISYDQQFRASLATGLTRWGYTDLNSATGTSIGYHWLAEAISGVLSRIASVDEFIVVTQTAPVLGFLAAVSAMWRLSRSFGLEGTAALFGVIVAAIVLLEMDPFSIGTLMGVGFSCYCMELSIRKELQFIEIPAVMVVATLSLMAQTPFGLPVLITSSVFISLKWREVKRSTIKAVTRTLVLLAPLGVLRLTVLAPGGDPVTSGSIGLDNVLQFGGLNVDFGIDTNSPAWLSALNSTGHLLELLIIAAPLFVILRSLRRLYEGIGNAPVAYPLQLLIFSVLIINVLDLSFAQTKLTSAVLIALVPGSIGWAWSMTRQLAGSSVGLVGVVAGLVLARVYFQLRNVEPDPLAAALSMTLLALAATLIVVSYRKLARPNELLRAKQPRSIRLASLTVLILVLAISVGRPDRISAITARQVVDPAQIEGVAELRACFAWIRHNTSTEAVIATDFFDPQGMTGSGKSHLVSLATKRRLLLDGLYTKTSLPDLIRERTLRPEAITDTIRTVDYYVISAKLANASTAPGLTVKLKNPSCVVLQA